MSYVQPGDILADKYCVTGTLGQGGMALVVAARHLQLNQTVAIKLMRSQAMAFPDAVDRFIREAQTVVRLYSENVARVMDVGLLPDGTPFMVMEYLEGVDLSSVLGHCGALAVQDAVDYVLQACAAMAEAHLAGIIHRDLKPGNLFLTQRPNGAPLIKVLDFGISKAQPEGKALVETHDFGTMGSPPYMSPEQAKSAKLVDTRSDIWSLGIILYQLVSGQLPFVADTAVEVFAKILHEQPPPLHQVAPWVPERFAAVVMRCLQKKPDDRYPGVVDLAADLARFASPEGRLLVDTSLIPARPSSRSTSNQRALSNPELRGDEDTEPAVLPGLVIVQEPSRLDLGILFHDVPMRPLQDAYPRTTHTLSTGERTAFDSIAHGRKRAFLAAGGLVTLLCAVAAAVTFFSTGTGLTGWWNAGGPGPDMDGTSNTVPDVGGTSNTRPEMGGTSLAGPEMGGTSLAGTSLAGPEMGGTSLAGTSLAGQSAAMPPGELAGAVDAGAPDAGVADAGVADAGATSKVTPKKQTKRTRKRKTRRRNQSTKPAEPDDPFGTIR